uniref:(northern house mosquito) hypothetical protein n=1 Tax=Culex pipiens TaxID=7175 RepID=A0A8D8CRP1_CULPI
MVGILLMGLPEHYESTSMGLEASGEAMSADAVKSKILQDVKVPSAGVQGHFRLRPKCKKLQEGWTFCYNCPEKVTTKEHKGECKHCEWPISAELHTVIRER